jgi:subtilisin family serine protease
MNRIWLGVVTVTAAAVLAACGGGQEETGPMATPTAVTGDSLKRSLAEPVRGEIDARLRDAKGEVEVWVSLDMNSVARTRALLTGGESGRARALRSPSGEGSTLAAAMAAQHASVLAQQASVGDRLSALGARELGRVQIAHNAIAVRIDAARLPELRTLPGVLRVRPVIHYEKHLGETVPYVGGAAVQAGGTTGAGVRVAVLDSGIDYTHKNLGGSGALADFATATANPAVIPGGGLYPTAKVVGGFDYTGSVWPNGARSEDPNPIDDGPAGGHGTHVADIIAGKSLDGTHKGMAPGAVLYAVKVCSSVSTSCNGIALLKGMDFAMNPDGNVATDDAVDVINLSLGSSYGQIEDDLSLAVSNAVAAGTVVVASAGNSADKPYVTGSPAMAPGVLSVAQTQVPSAEAFPLVVTGITPSTITNTATVDWAPLGSGFSGPVVRLGSGCPAGSINGVNPDEPYFNGNNPSGKVALIDRASCAISLKVDRATKAGAIAVIIANNVAGDPPSFSFGGGDQPLAPTIIIAQADGTRIKNALGAAGVNPAVVASVSSGSTLPLVGSMAASSSRGPSMNMHRIKPEIGAPGASVSAETGTGTGTTAFGGTSGAAPMVAGAAALMIEAHPARSALQVKAMLMNSADATVYTNPATRPGELAPITRIGSGELRVNRAVALSSAAWDKNALSAALSFGAVEADKQLILKRTLTVENYGASARTYAITPGFRFANDAASGAVLVQAPASVSVPAGGSTDVEVTLVINPANLPAWTLNGGSQGGNGALLNVPEYDGYLTLASGGETLAVPWHVLPRKAANTSGILPEGRRGPATAITLKNVGAAAGDYEVFSLIGTSPQIPAASLPGPGDNFAVADMRSVGVRYLPAATFGANYLEFAISNFGRNSHPNYPRAFEIYVDTDNDGTPNWIIFNGESGTFASSGQNRVFLSPYPSFAGSSVFFTDADLNSGTLIFTVLLNTTGLPPSQAGLPSLAVAAGTTLGIDVLAWDNYFTGAYTDQIAGMKFTPGSPKFAVSSGIPFGTVPVGGTSSVPFTRNAAVTSTETGLMFLYRRNAGSESQEIVIRPAHRQRDGRHPQGQSPRPGRLRCSTKAARWPASSRATASAPRRCSCAASIWRPARASAHCWSTPATPMPAPAPTAWRARAAPARRWPRCMGIQPQQVLPFSTGVIMETLPRRAHRGRLPAALAALRPDHGAWAEAAQGIMTTDTLPKAASRQLQIGGRHGHRHRHLQGRRHDPPEHGHDAGLRRHRRGDRAGLLQRLVKEAADASFNRITIDGDTSTNDSFVLIATHQAGMREITAGLGRRRALREAVIEVAQQLAQAIVRDGEGATKFITVQVTAAASRGRVPQGGLRHRALAAGQDGLLRQRPQPRPHPGGGGLRRHRRPGPGPDRPVPRRRARGAHGGRHPAYREEDGQRVMKQSEITVRVTCTAGRTTPRCGPATCRTTTSASTPTTGHGRAPLPCGPELPRRPMTPARPAHRPAVNGRLRARVGLALIGKPAGADMPSAAPAHPN